MATMPTVEEMARNVVEAAFNFKTDGKTLREWIDILKEYRPNGWISVKDRLPEDDENLHFYDDGHLRFTSVLVHDENRGTAIANRLMIRHHSMPILDELATEGWVWSRPYEPTHWMPLPEQPKEDSK